VSVELALSHLDVLDAQIARIRAAREALFSALAALVWLTVWPSRANFILFRVNAGRSVQVFESLKGKGVLVKCLHGSSPLLEDCLRVTVGTPDENRAFRSALRAVL